MSLGMAVGVAEQDLCGSGLKKPGQVGQVAWWLRKEIDNTQPDLPSSSHLSTQKVLFPLSAHPVLFLIPLAALRGSEGYRDSARVIPSTRDRDLTGGPGLLVVRPSHLGLGLWVSRGLWLSVGLLASLLG